jgi:hypothetical protein
MLDAVIVDLVPASVLNQSLGTIGNTLRCIDDIRVVF